MGPRYETETFLLVFKQFSSKQLKVAIKDYFTTYCARGRYLRHCLAAAARNSGVSGSVVVVDVDAAAAVAAL